MGAGPRTVLSAAVPPWHRQHCAGPWTTTRRSGREARKQGVPEGHGRRARAESGPWLSCRA